jgi:hypothetical protein
MSDADRVTWRDDARRQLLAACQQGELRKLPTAATPQQRAKIRFGLSAEVAFRRSAELLLAKHCADLRSGRLSKEWFIDFWQSIAALASREINEALIERIIGEPQ